MTTIPVTPEMIAAAWAEWKPRNPRRLGPGPGFVEAVQAAIAAAPSPWQPMSTAPMNGRHCILAVKSDVFVWSIQGCYDESRKVWTCAIGDDVKPLAWMPNVLLPDWATPWEQETRT